MTLGSDWEVDATAPTSTPLPLPVERLIARAARLSVDEIRALDLAEAHDRPSRMVIWDLLRDALDGDPDLHAQRLAARNRAWAAVNESLASVGLEPIVDDGYWRVSPRPGAGAARLARLAACGLLDPTRVDPEIVAILTAPWAAIVRRHLQDGTPLSPNVGTRRGIDPSTERRELEMLLEGQRRLLEVSRSVLTSVYPEVVLERIEAALRELVPYDNLVILEADWEARTFHPTLAHSTFVDDAARAAYMATSVPIDSGLAGWAIRTGEALNVVDAHADSRAVEIPGTADTHEQLAAVPLVENDIVTGALVVARIGEHDRAFTAAEFDLIQVFASLASIALQNAARYFKVRSYADLDTLTGLRNRGAFQRDLAALVASSSREPFALIVLDLDGFKAVNDTHGHPAGDGLLGRVGGAIGASCRGLDQAYRYGGDEFALLLRRTIPTEAAVVGDRVAMAIASLTSTDDIHVTASYGIAAWPADAEAGPDLVVVADKRQYEMKAAHHGVAR
jgi:diguanylate cyclase (GGDEF)-like protein